MDGATDGVERGWPVLALRLRVGETALRHVREGDLPHLAEILPDDYEHDPGVERFPAHDVAEHRRRLLYQGYWRSVGNWSPSSWCLDFLVANRGEVVGVQSLEAAQFLSVRTVDSGSWLATTARGRGIGVAMRRAVLALAFDHLGAYAAVSSARVDNAASLAVSRRLGYTENGVSLNAGIRGPDELQHMRLTRRAWDASGLRQDVQDYGRRLLPAMVRHSR
jgi:RimJ/RimL family protein N-acetyltransferase